AALCWRMMRFVRVTFVGGQREVDLFLVVFFLPPAASAVRLTTLAAMVYSCRSINRAILRGRWPLGKLIGLAYFCKTTIKNAMSAGVIPEIRAA
ncbi:MAG: hypothetical protein IKE64_05700, partial [Thermoguttaceae bacterium]|nr:hypothetical protein [Thermoguttaceae bacterium]